MIEIIVPVTINSFRIRQSSIISMFYVLQPNHNAYSYTLTDICIEMTIVLTNLIKYYFQRKITRTLSRKYIITTLFQRFNHLIKMYF